MTAWTWAPGCKARIIREVRVIGIVSDFRKARDVIRRKDFGSMADDARSRADGDASGEVARYFNSLDAAAYADHYLHEALDTSPSAYFFQRRRAIVMRYLQSMDGGAILDVGCGPGIFAGPCVEQGFRYHGIDISNRMIDEGRRRFGNLERIEFTVGDAQQLPLPSDSIDGLLCLGMLEYVSQEQEVLYLKEMARVVKPGGIAVFSFLNARSPHWLLNDYAFPIVRSGLWHIKEALNKSKLVAVRDFSAKAFSTRKFRSSERMALLRATGLSLVGITYFSANVLPPHIDSLVPRQSVWAAAKLEPLLAKPSLSWLGQGFVVAVRK